MKIQPITKTESGRGPIYQSGGASVLFHDGSPFDSDPLKRAFDLAVERDAELHNDLLPERISEARQRTLGALMSRASGDAINAARLAKSEAIAADARQMEPARPIEHAIGVELREHVRALPIADQARWIEQTNLEGLTAIVDGGNRAALEVNLYDRARERFWIENWIARHNAESNHPAQPSVDTVLATGPDHAALRAEAEGYLAQHRERMASIDDNEAIAKRLVGFLAAVFDITPEKALDRIVGRDDAQAA
ncbi:hypothetical protein [Qipengyuania spongiae]|uniref:Uncharacterized protein n=1 Tax=Qipengyuania spongiae TaxID=2909673 RepID=A0ABY5T2C3_9SPHN|nr:hypothetical protein [Qipengyuania spongiae]UVI39109.1 hypothetical protein L1F33_12865 [Qipengyuania spongiae]